MKKTIFLALLLGAFVGTANAGVSNIKNNGSISGASSYRVECTSGSGYIIYKKNGTWYRGDIGHMGNKYNSWSTNKLASYLCN